MDSRIFVTKSSMPKFEEYCDEIEELWESHWLTNNGIKHKQFEEQLKQYLGCNNISLFVNGHMALESTIAVMGFEPGSEIITTPYTFASTTHAIVRNGLVPVFCDVRSDDFTIDTSRIEKLITDKTAAILPVHVYGNLCDTDAIQRIAEKYGLKVIYDAAHAFGVEKDGVSAANYGDASIYSFHATKVFNTIEGGAVTFRDGSLSEKLADIKNFGIRNAESVQQIGANSKMNEFQAAMGICNLRHIDEEIEKRRIIYERYNKRFDNIKGILISHLAEGIRHNFSYYPVLFDGYRYSRDEVDQLLRSNGIFPRKYFYPLTNEFECYKDYPTARPEETPVAKHLADRIIVLPLYADLTIGEADKICDIILSEKEC